ncbi:MAG: class I poly(R)-hydroxyalkanoic acid synthase [Candidatus Eremiobacteraeota bacterium]|nr:class I poly(R)-hydroxyalkanoic acid synthase [Candidatus Eremiobacteraeota bacterium]
MSDDHKDVKKRSEVAPNALDPLGIAKAGAGVWQALATKPEAFLETQLALANAWMSVATRSFATAPESSDKATAVIEPAKNDSRWKHAAWKENPTFDALKQGYLLATQAVLEGIDRAPDVDEETKARVKFFAKQFCDAMSPTNFPFMNPAVIEETLKTGGRNLQKGADNVIADMRDNAGRPALVDKSAFEVGRNVATSKGRVVFRNELIELIQYAPTTENVFARPLLIVPPWINKFYILDLQPANSLIKYATDAGVQTFVVSWRNPDTSLAHLGFEDYLHLGPLAAGNVTRRITSSPDVNQIGYCIGGTLTAMQLAYLAKTDPSLVKAVTFFAALTDFTDVGDMRNFLGPEALAFVEERIEQNGVLAASDMSDTFNMLRSNDLIWNVAVNRYLLGKDAPAFDLLYWNSDATRMPAKMHRYYLANMYVRNALAKGELSIDGVPLDLHDVRNDTYAVASVEDHIAPWRSVYKMTQLLGGETRFRLGHSGHIAGIINSPAAGKGNYWANDVNPPDPETWLSSAEKRPGSWWPDWLAWLSERSGERVPAPASLGSTEYPPLDAAPGTYVMEKS